MANKAGRLDTEQQQALVDAVHTAVVSMVEMAQQVETKIGNIMNSEDPFAMSEHKQAAMEGLEPVMNACKKITEEGNQMDNLLKQVAERWQATLSTSKKKTEDAAKDLAAVAAKTKDAKNRK